MIERSGRFTKMYKMFVCLSFLLIVANVVQCKPDYIFNYEVDGWLKLHKIPATWNEAYLKCHYEGAVIASTVNEQMITALLDAKTELNLNATIYLGTHAQFSEGDFFSIEGVPLTDMPIKWGNNGSGAATGNCLTMTTDGRNYNMFTTPCEERHPYICYKRLGNNTELNECGTFDNKYQLNNSTGSCYKVHTDHQTWSRAHMICAAEGGYLVILNNKQEALIIKEMIPKRLSSSCCEWDAVFIGLRDLNNDRNWFTIHGEGVENVYHTWAPGQPDNRGGKQHCATLLRAGNMDDNYCSLRAMFVCEKDPNTTRFETPSLIVY